MKESTAQGGKFMSGVIVGSVLTMFSIVLGVSINRTLKEV